MTLFVTTYLHKSKISVFAPQILETKVTIRGGVFFFFFLFHLQVSVSILELLILISY